MSTMTHFKTFIRYLQTEARYAQTRISREIRRSPHYHPKCEINKRFELLLKIWKESRPAPLIARWLVTEWCNNDCHYCSQVHTRKRIIKKGPRKFYAHAFDNHPVETWIDAFKRLGQGRKLVLTITGGEPMLDQKNMVRFISEMVSAESVENIRIDTNAHWDPRPYRGIDKTRIFLMCTFHPSQIKEEDFIKRIAALRHERFNIAMINYVMTPAQARDFVRLKTLFGHMGIPLNSNPLWTDGKSRSHEEIAVLRQFLDDFDLMYRGQTSSPRGKFCLFPAISNEIDQAGALMVGCHPEYSGDLIKARYPLLPCGPVPCPARSCVCLDKYSFLDGCDRNTSLNPLKKYAEEAIKGM